MRPFTTDALVAGHFCLDVIPTFLGGDAPLSELLVPGRLVEMGNVVIGTGGAANNTALALHRRGFTVNIVAKIGRDAFGTAALDILRRAAPALADTMIASDADGTSYSIVINPPGVDRIFLHFPGANDTFVSADVPEASFDGARLLHFGYPPLMRSFYVNDGAQMKALFSRAKARGVTTSLDMAWPDPEGPSGRVDWPGFLKNVLPAVDLFLPSVDELFFMLDPGGLAALQKKAGGGNPAAHMGVSAIRAMAERMLEWGAAIVGLKLGDQGFYLRTTADASRLAALGHAAPSDVGGWRDQELLVGCREVRVVGTTGAGDCTIAGFLGAFLKGMTAEEAVLRAVCVGGASVEARDAHSGVPGWGELESRLAAGWPAAPSAVIPAGWRETAAGVYSSRG